MIVAASAKQILPTQMRAAHTAAHHVVETWIVAIHQLGARVCHASSMFECAESVVRSIATRIARYVVKALATWPHRSASLVACPMGVIQAFECPAGPGRRGSRARRSWMSRCFTEKLDVPLFHFEFSSERSPAALPPRKQL
jgi:hypothetical protein